MAIYHLGIQPIGRATRVSAADVAAYRAGERLIDARSGAVRDYSDRTDVAHREIVLPSRFAAGEAGWARDRQSLWNEAEATETRRDARFAREYQVALPTELDPERRQALALAFSRDLADRYGVAVDLAIHRPPLTGDPRNHHAHLLTTTREVGVAGLGLKSRAEWNDSRRIAEGRPPAFEEFRIVRGRWAELANEALHEAGIEARIDSRSLRAQGIDRESTHMPYNLYKAAQRELGPEVFARARELHRERVVSAPAPAATAPAPAAPRSLEDIQREARESWAAYRAAELAAARGEATSTREASADAAAVAKDRTRDSDLAL
jgi:ATP-dependent exoDNAse (exonuclease V) alpha subunit